MSNPPKSIFEELDGYTSELSTLQKKLEDDMPAKKPTKKPTKAKKRAEPIKTPDMDVIEVGPAYGPKCKAFPSESIKLKGKDEVIITYCAEHKRAHYFIVQPIEGTKKFQVTELCLGAPVSQVEATPSGDADTEEALENVEDYVEDCS